MKSFKQLQESLDKPFPLRLVAMDSSEWQEVYKFTTTDGRVGEVVFDGSRNRAATAFSDKDPLARCEVIFRIEGKAGVTGGGDAFRIFATVKKAIIDFAKKHPDLEWIELSAMKEKELRDTSTRVSLYGKMVKQIARLIKLPKVKTSEAGNGTYFVMSKK